jgi:hypothetical protein
MSLNKRKSLNKPSLQQLPFAAVVERERERERERKKERKREKKERERLQKLSFWCGCIYV